MLDREQVLEGAVAALNKVDQPWEVTIEGYSIVARWKWMDATFFSPADVNNQTKNFTFTVTLDENGYWKEMDEVRENEKSAGMSGGKLGLGTSFSSFKGKTTRKSWQFGLGKDNETGKVGLIGFKFDTTLVKQPIREYLTACGWNKAGFFSSEKPLNPPPETPSNSSAEFNNSNQVGSSVVKNESPEVIDNNQVGSSVVKNEIPEVNDNNQGGSSFSKIESPEVNDSNRGGSSSATIEPPEINSNVNNEKRGSTSSNQSTIIIVILAIAASCCMGLILLFAMGMLFY